MPNIGIEDWIQQNDITFKFWEKTQNSIDNVNCGIYPFRSQRDPASFKNLFWILLALDAMVPLAFKAFYKYSPSLELICFL